MKLESYEKIIAARNLKVGLEQPPLGMRDAQHLIECHKSMCASLDERPNLKSGELMIGAQDIQGLTKGINTSSERMLTSQNTREQAEHLASVMVLTNSAQPFQSFNKEVAMIMTDVAARAGGVDVDWKQLKRADLSAALDKLNPHATITNILEKSIQAKPQMEMTKLERDESYLRQAKDPAPTKSLAFLM